MYNTLSCNKGRNAVDNFKICSLNYQLRIDSLKCGLQKSQTFVFFFFDLRLAHGTFIFRQQKFIDVML